MRRFPFCYRSLLCQYHVKIFPLRRYSQQERCCSTLSAGNEKDGVIENFDGMIKRRRNEAQRSIVVRVGNPSGAEAVWQQCSAIGPVTALMHYTTADKKHANSKDMMLVEFANAECVNDMLRRGGCIQPQSVPVRSPFFSYKDSVKKQKKSGKHEGKISQELQSEANERCKQDEMPKLFRENIFDNGELLDQMTLCSSISDQMQMYYDFSKSSETQTRLRFMTCRQLEVALSGIFPYAYTIPFGSSVNGSGNCQSDLDMVLSFAPAESPVTCPSLEFCGPEDNVGNIDKRVVVLRYLEMVANLLYMMPGCRQMNKILRARVPIVKYNHKYTGLECDLSMNNWSGVYMSELLYHYCLVDRRVAPLLFSLRLWAKESRLTSVYPGRWITNFSITLMALHYLMVEGLLPSVHLLQKNARREDLRTAEEGLDCTFLRDVSLARGLLDETAYNKQSTSLEDLLKGFFEYYDKFNFQSKSVSLVTGAEILKPIQGALHIENPLSRDLNVSRNVTIEEVERFTGAVTKALRALDTAEQNPEQYGLSLLWGSEMRRNNSPVYHRGALNWTNLFKDEGSSSSSVKDISNVQIDPPATDTKNNVVKEENFIVQPTMPGAERSTEQSNKKLNVPKSNKIKSNKTKQRMKYSRS